VEQAPSACSTPPNKTGERRRREQASVMAIRQTLTGSQKNPPRMWYDNAQTWLEKDT
jgi:hypothetical protein